MVRFTAVGALVLLVGLTVAFGPADAADPVSGESIYQGTCLPCHGDKAQGNKALNAPALYPQESWYLKAQIQKFREGLRGVDSKDITGIIMKPFADALADEASIDAIASYVSSLEGATFQTATLKGDAEAGKKTYDTICLACHGADGTGNPALNSPSLLGQHDWYMVEQLNKFKNGLRGGNPKDVTGLQMKAMAATLATDDAVNNVVAYITKLGAAVGAATADE